MSKTPKTVNFCSIPSKLSIIQTWISRNWHFWNFSRGKLYTWNLLPRIRTRRNSTPSWMRQGQHVSKPFVSDRDVLFAEFCQFLTEMIRPKKEEIWRDDHDPWWESVDRITVLLTHNNQAWLIVISACLLHIRYTSHLGRFSDDWAPCETRRRSWGWWPFLCSKKGNQWTDRGGLFMLRYFNVAGKYWIYRWCSDVPIKSFIYRRCSTATFDYQRVIFALGMKPALNRNRRAVGWLVKN